MQLDLSPLAITVMLACLLKAKNLVYPVLTYAFCWQFLDGYISTLLFLHSSCFVNIMTCIQEFVKD